MTIANLVEPYLRAGWLTLLSLENGSKEQVRCFRANANDWEFFTDFVAFNDLAGINLYVDLLPSGCANQFYARYGTPVMET